MTATPFTAEDVKYTLELINNPDFRAGRRAGHELVRDIKVVSPTEITWRMEKRLRALSPRSLPGPSWCPSTSSTRPAIRTRRPSTMRRSAPGPSNGSSACRATTSRSPPTTDFYGEGPYLERLIFKYVPDLTVLYTQFQTGDIDYIGLQGITADHYEEATKLADRVVTPVPQPFIENIACNLGLPALQEQAVREALYYGMDKQSIIEAIYYGLPKPSESFLPQQSWAYNPDLPKHELRSREGQADPRRRRLEAGLGRRAREERRPARVRSTRPRPATTSASRRSSSCSRTGSDIGVKMTINNLPPAVMWGDYWMQSKFETAMVGIGFMIGPDPDASDFFASEVDRRPRAAPGRTPCQYSSPEVDKLLEEGQRRSTGRSARQIYRRCRRSTATDLPYLPIFQYAMVEGTKAGLPGLQAQHLRPDEHLERNQWYWAT